ncbi:probable leucine-rich repeat receptor-like serine/threonine-protein kinase At3g14840 isoform X1 [Quercus suber]|uniref:probable leucine-rich repeat receptor-like serine/threonine-protein kinase At3g14840 isoform X1 n=4 Tax=Quercus suber TaxID=58331 RepID=UPI000D294162|nr:putative leucine-rich repeat receptor-like serine/threonine-protein kinase [Quercus suber]
MQLEPLVKLLINWEREIGISEWTRALVMTKAGRQHKSIQISHSATTMLSSAIATSLTMVYATLFKYFLECRVLLVYFLQLLQNYPTSGLLISMLTTSVVIYHKNGLLYHWNICPSPRTTYQDQFQPTWEKITTLKILSIESNQFYGNVPTELGNLVNLEYLFLSANNLTGELPSTLTNLNKLTELRISSNNFIGRIPDFFQTWKQLQKLEIQASGLEGPIPPSISALSTLTELRISDLFGEGSKFPSLPGMTNMSRLLLRSCNIYGPIPPNISDLEQLQILDLSFNRLEGNVPDLGGLAKLEIVFLTSNLLTGSIPEWIKSSTYKIDISYYNFSESSAPASLCRDDLNLFKSSSGRDNLELLECLGESPCSQVSFEGVEL